MFTNIKDFTQFKYLSASKKTLNFRPIMSLPTTLTLTLLLIGLIRLSLSRIFENIKCQDLTSTHCAEIPTHSKYSIYRVTLPGIILVQVNHISLIENIIKCWEKFESHKPTIHRCQVHGQTSSNCNKKPVCVKCAERHHTRFCSKTLETPPTCANCKGAYLAN